MQLALKRKRLSGQTLTTTIMCRENPIKLHYSITSQALYCHSLHSPRLISACLSNCVIKTILSMGNVVYYRHHVYLLMATPWDWTYMLNPVSASHPHTLIKVIPLLIALRPLWYLMAACDLFWEIKGWRQIADYVDPINSETTFVLKPQIFKIIITIKSS